MAPSQKYQPLYATSNGDEDTSEVLELNAGPLSYYRHPKSAKIQLAAIAFLLLSNIILTILWIGSWTGKNQKVDLQCVRPRLTYCEFFQVSHYHVNIADSVI